MTPAGGRRRLPRVAAAVAAAVLCLAGSAVIPASAAPPADQEVEVAGGSPILLLLDTSGSMAEDDGTGVVKIEGAKTALLELLNQLPLDSQIGLRSYPAQGGTGCNEGTAAVPLAQRNPADMAAKIRAVTAVGDTPTAESLGAAAADLQRRGYRTGTIVLVSDGEHTCADPCPVAQQLRDSGLGLTVDTVGFRIDDAGADELRCISGATGGTYTPVEDSAELGKRLAELQGPALTLTVGDVPTFSPVSEGSLTMTARVENTSSVTARNVRLALTYDPASSGGAPSVRTPLRLLGNLEPGGTRSISWSAYPSRLRGSGQLDWTVTLTAIGTPVQAKAGTTALTEELRLDQAGPVLRGVDDVVIVGDSYSSGEGGGDYTGAACHRSPNAWGRKAFAASVTVHNLACSGAVIADYSATDHQARWNPFDNVSSQRDRLRGLAASGEADLVLLTMGGNDIQFAEIVTSCVTRPDCADFQICIPVFCGMSLRERTTALLAGLGPQLETFYEQVAQDSGTDVVVLPYPDLLPNTGRGRFRCNAGLPGFSPEELQFAVWVEDELNRQVAAAVEEAAHKGLPVHLARDVRTALLPQHTICDEDPWVVQVTDKALGVGLDDNTVPDLTIKPSQELVHPNAAGYHGMAAALIRWSRSPAAPPAPFSGKASGPGLFVGTAQWFGQLLEPGPITVDMAEPRPVLQAAAGSQLQVTSGGHLPGSLVVVGVQSTPQALGSGRADANGDVTVSVHLPGDLPAGEHTLTASGLTSDGSFEVLPQPLDVRRAVWWPPAAGAIAALATAGVGWLLIRIDRRRTARGTAGRTDPEGLAGG